MLQESFDQSFRANIWQQLCHSAQSHVALCPMPPSLLASELMRTVTSRFCSQDAPTTQEELWCRFTQSSGHSAVVGAITHADMDARLNPASSARQLAAIRPVCETDLPKTSSGFMALLGQLTAISLL
jgi:hypothetical protein